MGVELRMRALAAEAWAVGRERVITKGLEPTHRRIMVAAVLYFVCRVGSEPLQRVSRFISRWKDRGASTGGYHDAPGRGRRTKLTPDMCDSAVNILLNGWTTEEDQWAPFFDIDDALRKSADLRKIQRKARISSKTLWHRLVQHDKTLRRKMIYFKPQLTIQQKNDRIDACKALLAMPRRRLLDYLRCTFWIDAKKMYLSPARCKVICSTGKPVHNLSHPLRSPKKQDMVIVNYYAVVNFFVGPVLYVEVTGTTRYEGERYTKYQVGVRKGDKLTCSSSINALLTYSSHTPSSLQCSLSTLNPLLQASASHEASLTRLCSA